MGRKDYYYDSNAPVANSLVPGASAIVADEQGKIILQRRTDNNLWALPGGTMDIGESIRETILREVNEETGLNVEPLGIVGIYSDPNHVFEYSDGEVRQEFSICFACRILSGELQASDESHELAAVDPKELDKFDMHPSIRLRIDHYLEGRSQPVLA